MKKSAYLVVSGIIFAVLFASCGSKPKEEPKKPEPPVVEEPKEEEKEEPVQDVVVDEPAPTVSVEEACESYDTALALKNSIDEKGFADYDRKDYDAAVALLEEAKALLNEGGNPDVINEKSKLAYGKLKNVWNIAYRKLAQIERTNAIEAKRSADSVKAGVAEKAKYKEATDLLNAGDSSYAMQNPESAYNKYAEAGKIYSDLFETVSVKRSAAQAAIDEARRKVAESAAYAQDADIASPISGDNVQGIEDEDAVLLESDNYEDPNAAVADVSETLEDKELDEYPDVEPAQPPVAETSVTEPAPVTEPEVGEPSRTIEVPNTTLETDDTERLDSSVEPLVEVPESLEEAE